MKIFFSFLLVAAFVLPSAVLAQEAETSVEQILEAETVTAADLGVEDPGLLPTSPLYFFKEIGRGLQRALTFNAVKKTELELKITSEKAAEAKKVAEQDSSNERGISRALLNYERSQERLRARLESLRETSENPDIDRLLDMVAARQIAHEKLLQDLEAKHETQQTTIQNIRARVAETVGEIAEKDTAEKFRERLERAFEEGRGSTLKDVRSLEILDRLQESGSIPEKAREKLEALRATLSERAQEDVEEFVEQGEEGATRLREALQRIPGNALGRTRILEEIRARASQEAADALDEVREKLEEGVEEGKDFETEAEAQIRKTEEHIEKIEERMRQLGDATPQAARTLLDSAKKHLESAKEALAEGNPRNAFGLSRAAEAITINILRILEQGIDAVRSTPELLDRIRDRIQAVPLPIGRPSPHPTINTDDEDDVLCPQVFAPVCGVDGKTYSNTCVAEQQNNVHVKHEGECRDEKILERTDTLERQERDVVRVAPSRFEIKADDFRFDPAEIRVKRGAQVTLTFQVDRENVYFAGLDFRSPKFKTDQINPGDSVTVDFIADESFEFKSYWPASGVLKATGRVIVE